MKTNTKINKSRKGVTLIELTVVIAVILLLISILFIGVGFYKKSANKAACVVNINAFQKGARAVQNIDNLAVGGTIPAASVYGGADTPLPVYPSCPSGGVYTPATGVAVTIPASGTAILSCVTTPDEGHVPTSTAGW